MNIFALSVAAACGLAVTVLGGSVAPQQRYADTEWNVGVWGIYGWAGNAPFGPPEEARIQGGAAPFQSINTTSDISDKGDRYLGSRQAWGGGLDLKYFFFRYFGVGVEGYGLVANRDAPDSSIQKLVLGVKQTPIAPLGDENVRIGAGLGTFTIRLPIGRFAPYVFAGGGAVFGGGDVKHVRKIETLRGQQYGEVQVTDNSTEAVGQFGGGMEVRLTRHVGLIGDVSWNVVDGPKNNFGMVRTGLNFAF